MSRDPRTSVDTIDRAWEVSQPEPSRSKTFGLSLSGIIAGALAAACSAVAASWLGVAGTVIGAVVGSVLVTVSTAVFKHPLERGTAVLRTTIPVSTIPGSSVPATTIQRETPGPTTEHTWSSETETLDSSADRYAVAERHTYRAGRGLSWKRITVSALAALALCFVTLTGIELLLGRPVSSLIGNDNGGGTTVSRFVNHGSSQSGNDNNPGNSGGQSGSGGSTSEVPTIPNSTTPDSSTQDPSTDDPSTNDPSTDPPSTEAPSTDTPTDEAPSTEPPTSSDPQGQAVPETTVPESGGVAPTAQ